MAIYVSLVEVNEEKFDFHPHPLLDLAFYPFIESRIRLKAVNQALDRYYCYS